jgi:glycosyltransferase involved in cell wall biosynthesis
MSDHVHVAYLSLYPSGPHRHSGRSGVASYTANLADAVDDSGARVTVIAQIDDDEPSRAPAGKMDVRRSFHRGPRAYIDAARAAVRTSADVVHLQFETFLFGGLSSLAGLTPALAYLRNKGRRIVVTLHHVVDPTSVDREFVRRHRVRAPALLARAGIAGIQNAIRGLSDAVIVHEPSFADAIAGARVVRHGIESLPRPTRSDARARLGLDPARPMVLCFGFVAPYKGLEYAVDAARISGDAFDLVIAGGDHPRTAGRDTYATDLRRRANCSVRFTGFVPQPDVDAWFAAADVALFPYPSPFSSSGALALAIAYRTPALLSLPLADCIGAPASLTVPTDAAALSHELVRAVEDPRRSQEIDEATRGLARDRSWPQIGRRHVELYEEVMDAHRSPRRSVRAG